MNKKAYSALQLPAGIAVMGSGLVFIGHGVLATQKDAQWVQLFEHSLRFLPGGSPDSATVASLTQAIGIADIFFGLVLLVLGIGLFADGAAHRRLAISALMLVLLAIANFWQLMTSAAFIVADGTLLPGFWQLLERASGFILPLVALQLVVTLRKAR